MKKLFDAALQVRALAEDGTFSGYGSVFGVRDSYGDVVEPGAFATSLQAWAAKGKLPKMLWQHRASEPVGIWTKMHEDEKGLYVEGRLIREIARGAEAYALMKAGAVDGLSIGYVPVVEGWDKATQTNRVKQVDLWEVSPVTFPANEAAQIENVRSAPATLRELERALRDAGLSREQAKALMSRGAKALELRDAAESGPEDEVDPHSPAAKQLKELLEGGIAFMQSMRL